jgi:hypothetical protein
VLAYLGLDLAALGATSVGRFRLATAGWRAEAPLPFCGTGLSRYRLDQALLQAADQARRHGERATALAVNLRDPARNVTWPSAGFLLFLDRCQRSANHRHDAERPDPLQDLVHPAALDAHARETDHVGASKPRKIDVLDVFVDQRYVVMVRDDGRFARFLPGRCNAPCPKRRCRNGD